MTIQQILSAAGDGHLRDGSECSKELTTFLSEVSTDKLATYVEHCLTTPFTDSGKVLQDLVNELGRRLDFEVGNGLYQGRSNAAGNDGLWIAPEGNALVVEVKTTDAYRISLDTIASYQKKLQDSETIDVNSSILLVVGRQDTGELEAQVRGSKHAWDVRLLSTDALVSLVKLKESTDEPATLTKIRSVLVPMEYTRLDGLIDVMFTAAKDVETSTEAEVKGQTEADPSPTDANAEKKSSFQFTDSEKLQDKRLAIIAALGKREDATLIKKSRAMYWSPDHRIRAACSISKRYTDTGIAKYWYAYHPSWDEFLAESESGFFVLGCMDKPFAFAIPRGLVHSVLGDLNTTVKKDGSGQYWHIHILEPHPGVYELSLPKKPENLPLAAHRLDIGSDLTLPVA